MEALLPVIHAAEQTLNLPSFHYLQTFSFFSFAVQMQCDVVCLRCVGDISFCGSIEQIRFGIVLFRSNSWLCVV